MENADEIIVLILKPILSWCSSESFSKDLTKIIIILPGVPMHNLPDLKEKRRPLWNYQIPMLTDWKSHQHRAASSVQVKYWMLPGGKQVHRIDEYGREEGDTRRKILDKEHPSIPNHRVMSIGCLRVLEE